MATLTETAHLSRNLIKISGMVLVGLIVGRFSVDMFYRYWKTVHPDPLPPPTLSFGALPEIVFPQKTQAQITYDLEMPTGTFPDLPDRMEVYLMPEKRPRFLAPDQAIADAAALGYTGKPEIRSEVIYRFKNSTPLPSIMDLNIYTDKFTLTSDWSQDPNFFTKKELPQDAKAVDVVKTFLNKASLVSDDLDQGDNQISYLKASAGSYKPTISLSEADFVRVDIFRTKVKTQYETVTPDPNQGVVRAILSGNQDKGSVVQVEYNYYPVDYLSVGTYPIKTAAQAWSELQAGRGYVAQLDQGITTVTVRRAELGYWDSFDPQPYFQPVFIFRGDNNFVAYVSAVTTASPTP